MLIGGEWVDRDEVIEVRNPFDGSLIDAVPRANEDDVERAIQSAVRGFEIMRDLPAHQRSRILSKTAELIRERSEEFAVMIAKEVGKTIREARGEVSRAVQTFTLAAEEAKRICGETVPFDAAIGGERKMGFYIRVPVGVVLGITPFNFPLNLAAHKVAPALACGNSVILKPSSVTPLTDLMLGEVMLEAGLPGESLNIITGPGSSIGDLLISDPRIRMVTFTGSSEVGVEIMRKAGLKRTAMELGSNSAVIVMDDADLPSAASRILVGGYAVAGQVCISVQRVIVHERVYKDFLDELVPLVKGLKVGNQLDEATDMGPMISEDSAKRAEQWIGEAVEAGARGLLDAKRDGALLTPTVLIDVSTDMKVFREEAFAPFVVVMPCEDLDEGIRLVNDSKYGLQAGICTRDIGRAFEASKRIEAGGVMINDVPAFRVDLMPYGGMKESGIGREGPKYAVEEMTEMKLVCFNL
ncbi:MAG: aldehyde dehydrogenase family protein [bacterium]